MKYFLSLLILFSGLQALALEHPTCEVRVYKGIQGAGYAGKVRGTLLETLRAKGYRPIEIDGEMMKYDFDALIEGDLYAIESNSGCHAQQTIGLALWSCSQTVSFHRVAVEGDSTSTEHLRTVSAKFLFEKFLLQTPTRALQTRIAAQIPECVRR